MSIKYAVLGLIAEEPRHGYAVRAAFEQRLGDFWELNYGQVYQVLTALEGEGLITGADERIGRRPVRRIYSITAQGRDQLRRWLLRPASRRRPFRDEFYVRLLFAFSSGIEMVRQMVADEIRSCREHLAGLMDEARAVEGLGPEGSARRFFTRAAVLHAEADLKALDSCRATMEAREQPVTASAAPVAVPSRSRRRVVG